MAFDSTRDIPQTVTVPLEYSYIFERDKDGEIVTDAQTGQPRLHQFKLVMTTKRAAEIDQEEAARVKKLVAGNGYEPLSEVELLVRLTLSHEGFDDFPPCTAGVGEYAQNRKAFEQAMREYFGRENMQHFVNDALLRHQNILLPMPFRVGV
jgi:hypothetical protein